MNNPKSKVLKTSPAKQWYNIKSAKDPLWLAYELTQEQFDNVAPGYTTRGPFKSLLFCLIDSSS